MAFPYERFGLLYYQLPSKPGTVRGPHIDAFWSTRDFVILFELSIDFGRPSRWRQKHFAPETVRGGEDEMRPAVQPSAVGNDGNVVSGG